MTDKLDLALNHAMSSAVARARMSLLNQGIGHDAKRPQAWCEYGFPQEITFNDLYTMYRRGGIAHGAVEKIGPLQGRNRVGEEEQAVDRRRQVLAGCLRSRQAPFGGSVFRVAPAHQG